MLLVNEKQLLRISVSVLFIAIVFISGCQPIEEENNSSTQSSTVSNKQTPAADEETPAPTPPTESKNTSEELKTLSRDGITAKIASWEQLQQFVASQKGKIVVIDIWSTWCLPCVREYPHLVALQKKYPEKVVCVSFNINYDGSEKNPPESNADELLDFYIKQKSNIQNFISSTPDEELYEKIKLASIPVAYVYDTSGTLKKRFDNESKEYGKEGFNYENNIVPLIEQMLEKSSQ